MEIITTKKTIIKATSDELSKAENHMFEMLSYSNMPCGAWFETKEQAEDWGGDAILDAIAYYLESLGIEIEEI